VKLRSYPFEKSMAGVVDAFRIANGRVDSALWFALADTIQRGGVAFDPSTQAL
jgi:hypothetical protein